MKGCTMQDYAALDAAAAVEYIKNCPAVKSMFSKDAEITCREVGDGNLNLVFILENAKDSGQTVVIKQALPYLRCAGESWPLTLDRARMENQALVTEGSLCPEYVPKVYHYDPDMHLIVMENLNRHIIMRKGLIKRVKYPNFPDHIGKFMAVTLFKTSDLYLSAGRKKAEVVKYINDLCRITEDLVFTNPYKDSPDNRYNSLLQPQVDRLRANTDLKIQIAELKQGFLSNTQALVHGDLHTGSVMINQTETKVIDPEFAFYGPMGFDIGAMIANLALSYASHEVRTESAAEREDYRKYLLDTISRMWNVFADEFDRLWKNENNGDAAACDYWEHNGGEPAFKQYRSRYIRQVLQDSTGYAGCKMMRRILGLAHVEDIDGIEPPERRAVAESLALETGQRFVLNRRNVDTIQDVIDIIKSSKPCFRAS